MSGRRLTILIADDHPVYRQGLERAIGERPDLELVGSTADGREALERIHELEPDIAVVDVRMPGLDGLKIVGAVQRDGLRTKVMLLTGYEDSTAAYKALAEGAAGYVSKASDHTELCESIVAAGRGETVIAPQFAAGIATEIQLRETSERPALTGREGEVLRLLAEGRTAARIGEELHLSEATVKTHLHNLYDKLGVSDRAAAVATAMRWGLLE
ncbi:MAG TPA: response regulator transcription factor [Solirubrobacterales bacterium]|nr:response regulator transcription factor [Solirubrobacterales bacterium]